MKTRIRIIRKEGVATYYPQYHRFFWRHFGGYMYDTWVSTGFTTMEEAQKFIDKVLSDERATWSKPDVEHITYPYSQLEMR